MARIDELFTEIADGEAALARARADLDTWRRALLKAAVTGELTRGWRERNIVDETGDQLVRRIQHQHMFTIAPDTLSVGEHELGELPELPESWTWARASQICGFITKGTTPARSDFCSPKEGVPFLKVYNLTSNGSLNFDYRPSFVRREIHEGVLARSVARPGDVLMIIVGPPLGKISIVPSTISEANCNQAIAIFRPQIVNSRFLALTLSSETILSWATKRGKASVGQINLTLEICRDLSIPIPPLQEQVAILERMSEETSTLESTDNYFASASEDARKLNQSVLKAAFEGRLVAQDPRDEPAERLLARLGEQGGPSPALRRSGARRVARAAE